KYDDDNVLVLSIAGSEQVIRIHRYQRRTISLQVTVGDEPARGAKVLGWSRDCGCGACLAVLGTLDEEGRLRIVFYPEEGAPPYLADENQRELVLLRPDPEEQILKFPRGTKLLYRDPPW